MLSAVLGIHWGSWSVSPMGQGVGATVVLFGKCIACILECKFQGSHLVPSTQYMPIPRELGLSEYLANE